MDIFSQIGSQEILLILLVAILVIGPAKIVKFGQSIGNISRNLRKATSDFSSNLKAEIEEDEKTKKSTKVKQNPEAASDKKT